MTPSSPLVPGPERGPLAALAAIAGLAAATVFVFHGALGLYFSQDDFAALARAAGLAPRFTGPWRYLSLQAYFDAMFHLAGTNPLPYHVVSLGAHVACAAVLYRLLAHRLTPPAALVGAAFFTVHPALFTALYWITGIVDVLAALFALAAVGLALGPRRRRWLAIPCFALSLLSKESTVLLPGVVAVTGTWLAAGTASRRSDRAMIGALAAVSAAFVLYLGLTRRFGMEIASGGEAPYAFDLGSAWRNLLTYVGWTSNFLVPTVRRFSDAIEPQIFPFAGVVALAWIAGLFLPALRRRGWLAGGAAYLLLLLPVLPLRNHTYHYYLYAPLAATALCVAAATDAALRALARGRRAPPRPSGREGGRPAPAAAAWAGAVAVAALLALNGAALVRKVETRPLGRMPGLRADPTVDRARIAWNVREGLAGSRLPAHAILLFASRERLVAIAQGALPASARPGRETYWERNVRTALQDGAAVRIMFPQVDSVAFVQEFRPAPYNQLYAVYAPDGILQIHTPAALDSVLRMLPRAVSRRRG